MNNLNVVITAPMLTVAEYAERTGQTIPSVEAQIGNNILPIIQPKGARSTRFINMIELIKLCDQAEYQKPIHQRVVWG